MNIDNYKAIVVPEDKVATFDDLKNSGTNNFITLLPEDKIEIPSKELIKFQKDEFKGNSVISIFVELNGSLRKVPMGTFHKRYFLNAIQEILKEENNDLMLTLYRASNDQERLLTILGKTITVNKLLTGEQPDIQEGVTVGRKIINVPFFI